MTLQKHIPQSLQHFTDNLAAFDEQRLQELRDDVSRISKPEVIDMGTINLNDLLPDISIELSHIIALLQAAFEQIEPSRPAPRQTDVAAWLLSDALGEARDIYQRLYETKPLEEAA